MTAIKEKAAKKSTPKKEKKTPTQIAIVQQEERVEYLQKTPDVLLATAIEKGVDVAQLEKLMDLQEKWLKRRAKEEYNLAFSKFQAMAPDLRKNKLVQFDHREGGGKTNYKYQELGDIAKHIREPLAQCGLSYRWDQTEEKDQISVTCIISHIGGHEEKGSPLSGGLDTSGKKSLIQQKASTISYLRRYTLTGALGLSAVDEDNDGRDGAMPTPVVVLPKMTDDQLKGAVKAILSGTETIGTLRNSFNLTDNQEKALAKAQDEYMQNMSKPK